MSLEPSTIHMSVSDTDTPVKMAIDSEINVRVEEPTDELFQKVLKRTLTSLSDDMLADDITELYSYAFIGHDHLTSVDLAQIQIIGDNAFTDCGIASLYMPNLLTAGIWAFGGTALQEVNLPSLETVSMSMFQNCVNLKKADFQNAATIQERAFSGCVNLDTLVLRGNTVVVLGAGNQHFQGTKIKSGEGYIYVPRELLSNYRSNASWIIYAQRFLAIEDYEL